MFIPALEVGLLVAVVLLAVAIIWIMMTIFRCGHHVRTPSLWEALAELGMYVAFHCGIFFDGRESSYCRPSFYEAVHEAPNFKGHLAHVGWPWVDECIAMLKIGARFLR